MPLLWAGRALSQIPARGCLPKRATARDRPLQPESIPLRGPSPENRDRRSSKRHCPSLPPVCAGGAASPSSRQIKRVQGAMSAVAPSQFAHPRTARTPTGPPSQPGSRCRLEHRRWHRVTPPAGPVRPGVQQAPGWVRGFNWNRRRDQCQARRPGVDFTQSPSRLGLYRGIRVREQSGQIGHGIRRFQPAEHFRGVRADHCVTVVQGRGQRRHGGGAGHLQPAHRGVPRGCHHWVGKWRHERDHGRRGTDGGQRHGRHPLGCRVAGPEQRGQPRHGPSGSQQAERSRGVGALSWAAQMPAPSEGQR